MYFKERLYQKYLALFCLFFFAMASHSTLIAVYLADLGKSASEVSLVLVTFNLFSMIVQPAATELGERLGLKKAMTLMLGAAFFLSIGFYFTANIWLLAVIYGSVSSLIFSLIPFTDLLATLSPYRYGLIRYWGTLGFSIGAQITGLVYQYLFPKSIFVLFMITLVLTVWVLHSLLREPKMEAIHQEYTESKAHMASAERVTYRSAFSHRLFIIYLLIAFVIYGGNMINGTYMPVLFTSKGASVAAASFVISVALLGEVLMMLRSSTFMDRFSNKHILVAILSVNVVSFAANAFIDNFALLAVINILTRFTSSGTFIMLNIKIIHTLLGKGGTATGFAAVQIIGRSLGTVFFQMLAGPIIDSWGIQAIYLTLTIFSIGSLVTALLFFPVPEHPEIPLFS